MKFFVIYILIKLLVSIKVVMLVIVDNGNGAEEISRFIRVPSKIIKPSQIGKVKANAYILSDGDMKNQKENEKLIKKGATPVLGIGIGCIFIGSAFGAKIKSVPKTEKQERLTLKRPCPLTNDIKRVFAVHENYKHVLSELPENFTVAASSQKYEYEIIQEMSMPLFGVQFLPERGLDGITILNNFTQFIEMWKKYHK
mgnify:CR=1 FL=1